MPYIHVSTYLSYSNLYAAYTVKLTDNNTVVLLKTFIDILPLQQLYIIKSTIREKQQGNTQHLNIATNINWATCNVKYSNA